MRKTSALPGLVFFVIVAIGLAFAYLEYTRSAYGESLSIALGAAKPRLVSRVAAQIAVGASSGADAAAGLIFALIECRMTTPADKFTRDALRSSL
jgi:ACR3 family arsenite efflux pump ArsB